MHSPESTLARRSLPWAAATLPLTLAATLSAQTAAEPVAPAAGAQEVVVLSPFTVSDRQTQGYQATNSIGGTRSNTPIKDIPLNIQVFTKDLAQDIVATTQMDLERYNAAMVNGGADGKSTNTIQQPYNQFLFRGFVQNWGTRDGIRQYDPVDMQGISRVEVVKGPAAPLYGLSYAGGIMNSITKEVDFTGNATAIGGSVQSYGEWRATIDSNFVGQAGDAGKIGVRVNAARSNTADQREHSAGMVKYTQVNLAWQPRTGTELRFLAEEGYREKPNGLGFFIKKKSDGTNVAVDGVAGTERPLQVVYPHISWDWNWADRYNMRTIDTTLYRGTVTQTITKDLSVTGYLQYGTRNNIDSQGWDAANNGGTSGTGGSAAGWDMGWAGNALGGVETGWITNSAGQDVIRKAFHYRDWSNTMHGYGATALYKLQTGDIRHIFTAGANAWAEKFHSVKGTTKAGSAQVIDFPISTTIDTSAVPRDPGTDYYIDVGATAAENNSNDYVFASWQGYAFKDRLKVNLAINRTNIKNVQHTSPTENITKLSKNSPMYGVMFDLTKEVSLFAVHSSSLFPTTDKDSYWNQMPPTVGKSNEIGLKTELFGGKVSGTLSYYEISQTGGAQQDPLKVQVNGTLGDLVPGGKQESKGFEADLVLQPLPEWQILFSYAHNDQKTKTATNRYLIGAPSANGHIDDQCSILTKYTFSHGPVSGLSLGLGFKYTGKALVAFNYDPSSSVYEQYNPSNIYLETFASYKFKAFGYDHRIQLNVKNLTKVPEYIGWYAKSGESYATHRYEAPSKLTWTLGYAIEF